MSIARVLMVQRVAKETYSIRVEPLPNSDIRDIQPFNFFMVWIPRVDELPLSIANVEDSTYTFIFKIKGLGTSALSQLTPGQFIGLKGPLGKSFSINDPSKSVLVIAGGIGIAPIPLFIKKSECKRLDVVWGVKSEEELFSLDKLFPEIMGRYRLIVATEDCSHGLCGTVLDALDTLALDKYDIVLAVGPTSMLQRICERIAGDEVYIALETIVKCGIGICGSCYIKSSTKLLCIEGPVFKCSEVKKHLKTSFNS